MKQFTVAASTLFIGAFLTSLTFAEIRLPAILGNHMVLQENTLVSLWGWSEPGEKIDITVSWDTTIYQAKGSSGAKWSVKVQTPAAGGPYSITMKGRNTITISDVLIGEVWDCSGQSNMEMSFSWGIKQYTEDVDNSANQAIRLFHVPRLTADYPQDDLKGEWVVCSPEAVKTFSLAGYFFGSKLHQALSVPVGLIEANWGGTPAEVWTPKDLIEKNPVLQSAADSLKKSEGWPIEPAVAFNAMIYPLVNFTIAGVIWYQGESNVGTASTYHELFTTMIQSWRAAWKSDFPFYYVQIAPFSGYGGSRGAFLQEAQTKTLDVPKTGMVVVGDLVADLKNIHPTDKKDVGYRLADMALSKTYGQKDLPVDYPLFKSMNISKGKAVIIFQNVAKGLVVKGNALDGFYIAGADKVFKPAMAKIEGKTVVVWNKDVPNPVAVRFDFTNASIPDLFNKEGLPVNLFRTDDWNDVSTLSNE